LSNPTTLLVQQLHLDSAFAQTVAFFRFFELKYDGKSKFTIPVGELPLLTIVAAIILTMSIGMFSIYKAMSVRPAQVLRGV
jgi:hypothetical protein